PGAATPRRDFLCPLPLRRREADCLWPCHGPVPDFCTPAAAPPGSRGFCSRTMPACAPPFFLRRVLDRAARRSFTGGQIDRRFSNYLFYLFCSSVCKKGGGPMGDAFKALADPTRRRILELLAQGDLTAGEIAAQFAMTKPSVSHHLN